MPKELKGGEASRARNKIRVKQGIRASSLPTNPDALGSRNLFDTKHEDTSWAKVKEGAIDNAANTQQILESNKEALNNPKTATKTGMKIVKSDLLYKQPGSFGSPRYKHRPLPREEYTKPVGSKEPKLKPDEAIRAEASKTLKERRSSAARRLAVRGGGEDRRQALVKGLESRRVAKSINPSIKVQTPKTPGIKLRSVGGGIGLVAGAPSAAAKAIELNKAIKAKGKKPTLGEGMRMLLNIPQEEDALIKGKKVY